MTDALMRPIPWRIYCPDIVYTDIVSKHLVDIDDEVLSAARAQLGTATIKETVNAALRHVSRGRSRRVAKALDEFVRAKLEDRSRAWR